MLNRQTVTIWALLGGAWLLPGCSADSAEASDSMAGGGIPPSSYAESEPPIYPADQIDNASNEGDRYEDVGTNAFVVAAHDPLSTFAVDVDTASYDIFRRDINDGVLPQPASVRLEEYVNYFDYDYPKADADAEVPFSIELAAAPNLLERDTLVLRIGIQGKAAPEFVKRPANLVFLVDVSGSMGSVDKLPLVQDVLLMSLSVLDPTDTISIVTYASGTAVRLPPTPVSDRATLEATIQSLAAGGSTAGASGLTLAYEQAEAGFIEGGINHVLLCTDGDFNVGPSSTEELLSLIEQQRQTGVTLTALGFGVGNLNDAMMEAITNSGNGVYAVISDADQAQTYVQDRLLSTMNFIAKDVRLQVEFNPAEVYAYRLLGYENRAVLDEQYRDRTLDAGEIGAEHQVTALYEIVPNGTAVPSAEDAPEPEDGDPFDGTLLVSDDDLVLVKVAYKHPDAGVDDPIEEVSLSLTPSAVGDRVDALDSDFRFAVAVAAFAEILKQSPYADPEILPQLDSIVGAPEHAADPLRTEFVALFRTARGLLGR